MKISYAITACAEKEEMKKLIPFLIDNKDVNDEIVILFDAKNGDNDLLEYLIGFNLLPNVQTWRGFDFDGDFGKWKNKLNSYCTGDYILQLDGDETISKFLMVNLKTIVEANSTIDLFLLPRVNVVDGITNDDITNWNWKLNEKGHINWPDFQTRLYRRDLKWSGKVHERILDGNKVTMFPEDERFAIIHHKNISRQRKQNEYYQSISENTLKSLKEIYKNYADDTNSGSGDKGTHHSYIDVYEEFFKNHRKGSSVLEIGVYRGLSIKMWNEYFIDSKIYGVDICEGFYVNGIFQDIRKNAEKLISEGYKIFIDDASKPSFVDKIKNLKFDIIIDDGSHVFIDQIKSFLLLKDFMKPNGLYVIEDVHDIDNQKPFFEKLHHNIKVIDNRQLMNRHDDVLIIYQF